MTISFNEIPSNLLVPFVAVEIDASQASQGPALIQYRGLIIGQKLAAGSAAANSLHRVTNEQQVIALAGRGSMLHRQAISWFANNRVTEVWIGVLADGAGDAADGTITIADENPSVPGAEAGELALYFGDVRIAVAVADGDDEEDVAAAIAAAINDEDDLPITATALGGVVTYVFRHAGTVGNSYPVTHSYRDGEEVPAGIDITIVQASGGTVDPTLDTLIAAMGDQWFQIWAHPYIDATSLGDIETELTSRFGPLRMIDGVAITSAAGSHGTLTSLGDGRNSKHSVIMAQAGINPLTPPFEFAAEVAGIAALEGAKDPARPLQTLTLRKALPPRETDLFTIEERNQLLLDGIGTSRVSGTSVQLDRVVTTYQLNSANAPDTAYRDITTLLTLLYLRYSFRVGFQTKYPRHKLAADGTRFGPGQAVITPKLGKGEAVSWFRQMEELGLVEGFDQFKRDLICLRSTTDPNRLEFLLPTDLINFLAVVASQIAFRQ